MSFIPLLLLFLLPLRVLLSPQVEPDPDAVGFYANLQYRQTLTLTHSSSPSRLEEFFFLDTYSLHNSDPPKLDASCADLMIIRTSHTDQTSHVLNFWLETPCPGVSEDSPFTTVWVEIPAEHDQHLGDALWLLYGSSGVDSVSLISTGQLDFTGSRVVFVHGLMCPTGWSVVLEWNAAEAYAVSKSSRAPGGNGVVLSSDHTHKILASNITCDTPMATPEPDVCRGLVGGVDPVTDFFHSHHGLHESTTTDVSRMPNPETFRLVGCQSDSGGLLTNIAIPESGSPPPRWVAMFTSKRSVSSPWEYHSESEGNYLGFGSNIGTSPAEGPHGHSVSAYVSDSWSFSMDYAEDIVPLMGMKKVAAQDHPHKLSGIDLNEHATAGYSRDFAHFYFRGDGVPFLLDVSSDSWTSEVEEMIHVFMSTTIPPLGYELIPGDGNRLIMGLSADSIQTSFASPVDVAPHTHSIQLATLTSMIASMSTQLMTDMCGGPVWGDGVMDGTSQGHSCRGSTLGADPDLPDHVGLAFAVRYDTPERILRLLNGTEEKFVPVVVPPKTYMTYVYAGIGAGGGVILGVVGLALLLVVVCCCVQKRNTLAGVGLKTPLSREVDSVTVTVQQELFRIDASEITLLSEIGRGGGGAVVYRAKWSGREVAYKLFATSRGSFESDKEQFSEFEKEVSFASSLKHPNIVIFYGAVLNERLGIVMEYCEYGDLDVYLQQRTQAGSPVSPEKKMEIVLEIAQGLAYLHSKKIIHRDLKPGNVLLDSKEHAKIMDFGISRMLATTGKMTTRIGTSVYMAPEIVLGGLYGTKADMFSFGILMFEVLSECWHPYGIEAESRGPIEFRVAQNPSFRPDMTKTSIPRWLQSFISRCWSHEPESRPTFLEVCEWLEKQ